MELHVSEHRCPDCGRSYTIINENMYGAYIRMCYDCLTAKIFVLEEKIERIYKFLNAVESLNIR